MNLSTAYFSKVLKTSAQKKHFLKNLLLRNLIIYYTRIIFLRFNYICSPTSLTLNVMHWQSNANFTVIIFRLPRNTYKSHGIIHKAASPHHASHTVVISYRKIFNSEIKINKYTDVHVNILECIGGFRLKQNNRNK